MVVPSNGGQYDDSPAILVDGVSKYYPRPKLLGFLSGRDNAPDALHDVTMQVREGEIVGLLGPNGAGKTTLLKIIAGSLYPSSGTVRVQGRMGLVTSDERSFYWRLSGHQNLDFSRPCIKFRRSWRRVQGSRGAGSAHAVVGRGPALRYVLIRDEAAHGDRPRTAGRSRRDSVRRTDTCARPGLGARHPAMGEKFGNRSAPAHQSSDRNEPVGRSRAVVRSRDHPESRTHRRLRNDTGHPVAFPAMRRASHRRPRDSEHAASHAGRGMRLSEAHGRVGRRATTLRLDAEKDSLALSRVLERVLATGGTVESCQTEELPFDQVFCSLVLEEAPAAAGAHV